jgi:hypothetical protein
MINFAPQTRWMQAFAWRAPACTHIARFDAAYPCPNRGADFRRASTGKSRG